MAEWERGVNRRKLANVPKLVAANGTDIAVAGEATLNFEVSGRAAKMKFLDADVKRPLGAVCEMVDEGNTVVFSRGLD